MVTRRAFLRSGVVWTGLLWVPKAAAQQSALAPRIGTFAKPVAASAGCSLWIQQTTDNDYWGGIANWFMSQKIKNTSGSDITICRVDFIYHDVSGSAQNVYAKVRSGQQGGGSDYGSSSTTVNVSANFYNWVTFEWSSGKPVVPASTDFWVGWYSPTDSHRCHSASGGTAYETTSYAFWQGTTERSTYDLCFKLYTE